MHPAMLANVPQVLEFLCCISVCVYVGGASHLAFCHSSWMSLCISVAVLIVVHGTGVCGGSFVYMYPML